MARNFMYNNQKSSQGLAGRGKMKFLRVLALLVVNAPLWAQPAFHNLGRVRIHPRGNLGFHIPLINDTPFEGNSGLAGFYGEGELRVSGVLPPEFYDVELFNPKGVFLETTVRISHHANFILGDWQASSTVGQAQLQFEAGSMYTGASERSKVTGAVAITNIRDFTFPIGDPLQFRPLRLMAEDSIPYARCRYFSTDPGGLQAIANSKANLGNLMITAISDREYWTLEADSPLRICLEWNSSSGLASLARDTDQLVILGWNKKTNRWQDLGKVSQSGNLWEGKMTSGTFLPDDFEVITFGSHERETGIVRADNWLLTPNGDHVNDFLQFPHPQSNSYHLKIYDRNGIKVFDQGNYSGGFVGESNSGRWPIQQHLGLPEGIYFYLLHTRDSSAIYQGFLYLNR